MSYDALFNEMPEWNPNTNDNAPSVVYPTIDMFKEEALPLKGKIREIKSLESGDRKVAIDIIDHEATVVDVFANRQGDQFFRAVKNGGHPTLNKVEHLDSIIGRRCAVILRKNANRSIGYDVSQIRLDLSKQTAPVIEPAKQDDEDLPF